MHRKLINLILLIMLVGSAPKCVAQISGDYQSKKTGNWSSTGTWLKYNGSSWVTATTTPTSGSGVITIQSGDTVKVTGNVTVDEVVVSSGGMILINDGITLTLNNGTGTDLDVYGTVQEIGTGSTGASITINSGATIVFESTGIYQHNFSSTSTQGSIPIATWDDGSTCEVIGFVSPTTNHVSNLNQSFSNFTWDCPNQTVAYGMTGQLMTVRGNFSMISSGSTPQIVYGIGADNGNTNYTMTISGNMIISGGIFDFANNTGNSGIYTLNIGGNYDQTGGTFQSDYTGGLAVNFTGSNNTLILSAGTLASTNMNFYVTNGALLTLNNNIPVSTSFTVSSGGTFNLGAYIVSGAGTFTNSSGGTLMMGSTDGIAASGASGNIQVTGTRSFSIGGNYTYDGSATQISGTGLPSQVNNLTLNNASNATLTASTSVAGTMYLTSGVWIATTDTLTLGTTTSTLGTLSITGGWVDGYFRRWVAASATSNIIFPVGTLTNYNEAVFSFTTAPTKAGSIVSNFIPTNPGTLGFPLTDAGVSLVNIGYGYWNFSAANSFAGGTFNVNLYANGFPGVVDYTQLRIVQRTGSGASWTLNGTHAAGTGSNEGPIANRTGMTLLGNYGVASPAINPLPVELISFEATPEAGYIALSWVTASEINNDYFTVERSQDGISFDELLRKPGSGTTTTEHIYSAIDDAPVTGISYYRLKQTDYNGKFTYSPMEAVAYGSMNSSGNIAIKTIGPNPFTTENFNINYSVAKQGEVEIQIANSLGQIVYKEILNADKGFNSYSFNNHSNLAQGIYFVDVISDGEMVTKMMNKQ